MKNRTMYGALAVALTASLAVAGCSSNKTDGATAPTSQDQAGAVKSSIQVNKQDRANLEQGGTLTLEFSQMPTTWNTWKNGGNLSDISALVQATDPNLFNVAPDGTVSNNPDFMTAMPKAEEKGGKEVITYQMNPKAKWNDGTPIDYTAFAATWNAMKAPVKTGGFDNASTTGYEDIEKVEKGASPTEVVVTFKKKYYPITEVFGGLLHPKVGNDKAMFNTGEAVATPHNEFRAGPFVIDKVDTTANNVTLTPNPNWWGEKPLLGKIVYRQMEDSATIPAFKNGELDATRVGNKSRYSQIQGAKDLDIRRGPDLAERVLIFNTKGDGLGDVAVRKAMWQAMDRTQWKKIRYDGVNWTEPDLGSNMYFTFQKGYEDNFPVKPSVEDAKKTLEAAGYKRGSDGFYAKDGKKVSFKYTAFGDDPIVQALAGLIKNQAKAAGMDVTLDLRPSAAFAAAMDKKDFGLIGMGFTPGSTSPIASVCQQMCSTNPNNLSNAGTPELDARIAKVGEIADRDAQAKEINAIEKEWMAKTYGMMPIASGPAIWAVRKGLANWGPDQFQGLAEHWENVGWVKGSTHK